MKKLLFILLPLFILLSGCMYSGEPTEQSFEESTFETVESESVMAEDLIVSLGIEPTEEINFTVVEEDDESGVLLSVQIAESVEDSSEDRGWDIEQGDGTIIHTHDPNMQHEIPKNSLIFPNQETGYDWQATDTKVSVWVGVDIDSRPNKLGNYQYKVYMTSNEYVNDSLVSTVMVTDVDIMVFSETDYAKSRSDERGLLQSKENFKQQVIEEKNSMGYGDDLYQQTEFFKPLTLFISGEHTLVHSFYLPDNKSEIIVSWSLIKKLEK